MTTAEPEIKLHRDFYIGADLDRLWFERHPDRTLRLREPVGVEAKALGHDPTRHPGRVIIVTAQLAPGLRLRRVITVPPWRPAPIDSEETARRLLEEHL